MSSPLALAALFAGAAAAAAAAPQAASPDEIRSLVAEMLADAESRTSLLQGAPGSAGHDGAFYLASPDGNFRMAVSGQIQFRYVTNFRDDAGGDDDSTSGFSTSRTALRLDGHVFDPSLFYGVQANFDSDGGDLMLEDAFVGKKFENDFIVIWGQYREPILWEDVLNEKYSLAVDQSVMNAVFFQGRSQGVWGHYLADDWRFWAGFSDGIRSANTDLDMESADWAATTRWEWKFAGDWGQFNQFSSPRGAEFASKLGGGLHYEASPDTPGAIVTDTFAWTADLMFAGDGWNFFMAGVGFHTEPDVGASFDDYGFMAQGGCFVADDWELFGRYDAVIPDGDRAGDDTFNTLTFGANYYIHGHAARFTADVVWYLDAVADNDLVAGAAATNPAAPRMGLLPATDEDQVALRFQFQLLF